MNLYELTESYQQILDAIEEMHEQGSNDMEVLYDTLESIEDTMQDKVDGIVYLIKNSEARAKALAEEEKAFREKKKAEENKVKQLKELLNMHLDIRQVDKVKTDRFNVWRQSNPPSLQVMDEESIPTVWFEVPEPQPRLKKRDLLNHIKETGEAIDGVAVTQTKGVRIR